MQQTTLTLPEIKLVGISARTNLASELNPMTAKIGLTVQKYFQEDIASQIAHPVKPSMTYCVYTEYESDYNGDYTYFIGQEVSSFENISANLQHMAIPSQTYAKFTTEPGVVPAVIISAWQKVWLMSKAQLGGKRAYIADFEVYDERAANPQSTVLDVYVGIA